MAVEEEPGCRAGTGGCMATASAASNLVSTKRCQAERLSQKNLFASQVAPPQRECEGFLKCIKQMRSPKREGKANKSFPQAGFGNPTLTEKIHSYRIAQSKGHYAPWKKR